MKSDAMHAVELSDADLVQETLEGDPEAFGQIVERYQTLIASLAYCATGNVSRSEDLAQETFITAWTQLAELREPAKLRPWLCTITRCLVSKQLRRQGREPLNEAESLDTLDDWTSPEPLPLDHAISHEELSLLWRSLERIPPAYREPLVLFYREHQSIEAVAKGLGLSEDAVKQRLSRGRKFLQEQFLAFVAGALAQTCPGKTFALGVLAALPLLGATAKGATVGTALAKHGSVAAKTTSSSGILQAISYGFMSIVYWVAAALPLGGYIGFKMGGDSQKSERARRSVATFWRIIGISMLCFFYLPVPVLVLLAKMTHASNASRYAMTGFWVNVGLPVFMFGVVPLSFAVWIWQRRWRTVPEEANGGPNSGQSTKPITIWVVLAMILALVCLVYSCWFHGLTSGRAKSRYISTSEVQDLIVNSKGRDIGFTLFQKESGARLLYGELHENGTLSTLVAPAENSTIALLSEKGISYETKIENQDYAQGGRAQWLLDPFCIFILVAGTVTLFCRRRCGQSGSRAITGPTNERHVDRAFAALAACGMVALAISVAIKTDWKVRRIASDQVAKVIAQQAHAQFHVYQYPDGSRKLWISGRLTPDFIAPADESTLGLLSRQGIIFQTYVAGAAGLPGRSQSNAVLWILVLTASAAGLSWWAMKGPLLRPVSILPRQTSRE
jgi:RNA polymerase sigma factor (sigma-70 family)